MTRAYCSSCGFPLTRTEAVYYNGQCEACVEDDCAQLQEWMQGKPDAALDHFFSVEPKKEIH